MSWALAILCWFTCGYWAAGAAYRHSQRRFPDQQTREDRLEDVSFSCFVFCLGFIGSVICFYTGSWVYGCEWNWPFAPEDTRHVKP
jgi:hypothetical protein